MLSEKPMMNKKLGYYTVDNQIFESKIRALIHATNTKKPVRWFFNNDEFETTNWAVEPNETLNQLYRQRARQLREKYDYLVLCYSGGSDSNNILEAFIAEGLVIDEIVTNFIIGATRSIANQDITSTKAENHNAEWDLLTKGRMQYIHDKMPGAKISNFDMSNPILENFHSHLDGSWVLNCREWANPMSTARYDIIHDISLRKQFDKSKSVGVILGVDKPPLIIRDGRLFLQFTDTIANITPLSEHIKSYDNSTMELFYWSPDSSNILRKQAWTVLKFLRANKQYQDLWDRASKFPGHPLYNKARTLKESLLRSIVYTTWNKNWFQAEKGTIGWTNINDAWFFEGFKDTLEHQAWRNGIEYLTKNIAEDFMMLEEDRFKPITGPSYLIGTLQVPI